MCIDALLRQLQQLRLSDDEDLPQQLLQCVESYAPLSSWSCLRLASRQLAAAVDQFNSTLRITDCDYLPSEARLVVIRQHIKQLRVHSTHLAWHKVQHLVQCNPEHGLHGLPQLQHLIIQNNVAVSIPPTSAMHLSNLTRLDIRCPATATLPGCVQLPHVKAASFACTVQLAHIAAFAPNVEQLWASNLITCPYHSTPGGWRYSSGVAALQAAPVLPRCTHLGYRTLAADSRFVSAAVGASVHLYNTASTAPAVPESSSTAVVPVSGPPEDAAEAAADPFPNLRVLSYLPAVKPPSSISSFALPYSDSGVVGPADLVYGPLGSCSSVQAVCMSGHMGYKAAAARLRGLVALEQLTRLSLHSGSRCISAFSSITLLSELPHLQHVRVTGSCRRPSRVALLLDKLEQLPQLHSLALPAELLCDRCCSAAASYAIQHSMWNLVQQCSNLSRLVFLPGTATHAGSVVVCAHPDRASDSAALLGTVWQAAAVFAGLSLEAKCAAEAKPASPPQGQSSKIAGLKQQWQRQQQELLQQQQQQMQQRVEQLHMQVIGLPHGCGSGCGGFGAGLKEACHYSAISAECYSSDGCAVGRGAAASSVWGIYGPQGEW